MGSFRKARREVNALGAWAREQRENREDEEGNVRGRSPRTRTLDAHYHGRTRADDGAQWDAISRRWVAVADGEILPSYTADTIAPTESATQYGERA